MSKQYNATLQLYNTYLQNLLNAASELPEYQAFQDKTVTPTTSEQVITADAGYAGLDTVTVNAMPLADQATPIISIDNSTGLITATADQAAGYVTTGTKTATKQLAFQAAKTITPGTTDQIAVPTGTYVGGNITVAGDANLAAENIKNGISIFGVAGNMRVDNTIDQLFDGTITSYTNDNILTIGAGAFYGCTKLASVSFPACTTIGGWAFIDCTSLVSVSFPACKTIDNNAFYGCTKLTSVSFPACVTIGNDAFNRCTSLVSVNFPACKTIGSWAFSSCAKLTSVSFPACATIGNYAFASCTSLVSIYLMASSVCQLAASTAFSNTGIGSNKGSIFVPASLVASYKAATNWTYFSNRIFGV